MLTIAQKRDVIACLLRAGKPVLAESLSAVPSTVIAARKLEPKLRQQVNHDLDKAGFGGKGRYRKIGQALNGIAKVLNDHGLQQGETFDANLFRDKSGQRSFDIEFVNPDDSFSPEAISNSMLAIQWTELRPGTIEVIAYLS